MDKICRHAIYLNYTCLFFLSLFLLVPYKIYMKEQECRHRHLDEGTNWLNGEHNGWFMSLLCHVNGHNLRSDYNSGRTIFICDVTNTTQTSRTTTLVRTKYKKTEKKTQANTKVKQSSDPYNSERSDLSFTLIW